MEKVPAYVTQTEGVLNGVQQDYPNMQSVGEVQEHLQDHLFHGLQKQLCDLVHYLYDELGVMYPQVMSSLES